MLNDLNVSNYAIVRIRLGEGEGREREEIEKWIEKVIEGKGYRERDRYR